LVGCIVTECGCPGISTGRRYRWNNCFPTTAHLIELGAIAVMRTFLNYFLGRELSEEKRVLNERVEIKKKIVHD
jgi:hypothetical protein